MQKRALLALLLAMTLVLTGCALVVKDQAVDDATEIIRLGDTVYTKKEVLEEVDEELYNNYINSYYMYYYGFTSTLYDPTNASNIAAAKDTVVQQLTEQAVQIEKARELGLDSFSAEDEEQIASRAEEDWQSLLESAKSQLFADTVLEGEALDAAILASVTDLGYSYDSYLADSREEVLLEKLRTTALADMPAITEADLQAELDSRVESAKTTYETSPASYGNALLNGTTVYYRPAGYRMVQQVLISFTEEDEASMTDLESRVDAAQDAVDELLAQLTEAQATPTDVDVEEETEEATDSDLLASATDIAALEEQLADAQAELDRLNSELDALTEAAFASLDETADEVLARLAEGEDIVALAEAFSGDRDADGNVNNPDGYPVSEAMTRYDEAFKTAALALENVGDVSGKVRGMYGYYILKYTSDVEEGPVTLDEVRETITQSVTSTKENAFYTETLAKWVTDSKVKVNRKALDD